MQNAQISKVGSLPISGRQSDGLCPFFVNPLHQLEVVTDLNPYSVLSALCLNVIEFFKWLEVKNGHGTKKKE